MKKIITLVLLLASFGVFAQREVAKKVNELIAQKADFKHFSVLTTSNGIDDAEVNKAVSKATLAKIDMQSVADLVANKYENIEVEVPYQGAVIVTQLYKVDIFAEGFHVDTDQSKSISYEKGVYYRGTIKGEPQSTVSFNFFNGELNGVISNDVFNNLVIAKLVKKDNVSDYIVYSDADLKVLNNFECHAKDILGPQTNKIKNKTTEALMTNRCVTMYFEIDQNLYQQNGSSTTTTTNWMTSVFNNVQTLYTNDGILVSLKSLYIWTTQDPYNGIGTSSSDYLYAFNAHRPVFDGDVGQLVGIDAGGLGGVAVVINGLCSQNNYSYADVAFQYSTVPTFSWTIEVITHEFGHLLGSPHTHGCYWNGNNTAIDGCAPTANSTYAEGTCPIGPVPSSTVKGTIMSYCHLLNNVGINLANGFGPQPKALIIATINAGTCLSSDCINTCYNNVSAIAVSNITNTTATINWTDASSAASWEIAVTPSTSTTPVWVSVTTQPYNVTNLLPNTFYVVNVRPLCGFSLIAPDQQIVFVTPTDYCNGIVLTDTGGVSGNYQDSETYVRTIIPNLANKKISITFSSFDLEDTYDFLYVYDGNSTSATDLSSGGFTGSTNPGTFTSTAADGSLTIKFYSDGGVVAAGYVANVACISTLGTTEFAPNIDFTYYPNPSNGVVSISSKTQMNEIFVYNPEGRLLYQKKINGSDTQVDISTFAVGTYFFKLKFNEKEANFKILKMN